MKLMKVWWGAGVLMVLGILLCGYVVGQGALGGRGSQSRDAEPREITVRGVAEVIVPPDFVTMDTRVVTLDMDLTKSQAENDEKVKAVLALIDELGIEPKDVRTSYASLGPKERRERDKPPVFEGYEASKSITVVLRDLSQYEGLLSGMLKLGVNRVSGIKFGATDEIEKRREARILAVRAAREKAEYLARELGQKVGQPLWVAEFKRESFGPSPMSNAAFFSGREVEAETDSELGTIAPGSITVRAQIEASFELMD